MILLMPTRQGKAVSSIVNLEISISNNAKLYTRRDEKFIILYKAKLML